MEEEYPLSMEALLGACWGCMQGVIMLRNALYPKHTPQCCGQAICIVANLCCSIQ